MDEPGRIAEQRELALVDGVIVATAPRVSALRQRAELSAAVDHVFVHQINSAIIPRTAAGLAVADSIVEIFAVGQNVVGAESGVDDGLGFVQAGFVHLTANVCALRGVGRVHGCGVQVRVRDNEGMVGGAVRVAAAIPVVKSTEAPVPAVDRPVVADIEVGEFAGADGCTLCGGEAAAQVLATIDGVMAGGAVAYQQGEQGGRKDAGLDDLRAVGGLNEQLVRAEGFQGFGKLRNRFLNRGFHCITSKSNKLQFAVGQQNYAV